MIKLFIFWDIRIKRLQNLKLLGTAEQAPLIINWGVYNHISFRKSCDEWYS
jgi:hypothetical protein